MSAENEELVEAFPEIFPGATRWAYSDEPEFSQGIVCVSEEGLRSLLRTVRDAGDYMIWELMKRTCLDGDHAKRQEGMLPGLTNELSCIWCEQDLVVSGLFVTGEPATNEDIEDAKRPPNKARAEAKADVSKKEQIDDTPPRVPSRVDSHDVMPYHLHGGAVDIPTAGVLQDQIDHLFQIIAHLQARVASLEHRTADKDSLIGESHTSKLLTGRDD